MCGIVGVAGTAQSVSRLPADALATLRHRGPDAEGHYRHEGEAGSWELGHTRLSIVDLTDAGSQPMASPDGTLVMVFNGEIYNYPDLRRHCEAKGRRFRSRMDGEVILHLWEMEGPSCLARLNGIFAVAVANTETEEIVVARDPLGVKPVFYSRGPDNALWFASELRSLNAAGAHLGNPDPVALTQFLSFLWIPDPRTPYDNASTLEPGQALRWTPARTEFFRYVPALEPSTENTPLSATEALGAVRSRFSEAATRQLLSDVPIGLMASGGVDSGLIWWATRDVLGRAFTIDWNDVDGKDADDHERLDDDRRAVAELQRTFGTTVDYLPGSEATDGLPPSGDLFADPAYGLTRLIAESASREGYKVLLSGQGGDELFAGYRRHFVAPLLDRLRIAPLASVLTAAARRLPGRRLSSEYATRLTRAVGERDSFRAYMQLCTYSTASERADALGCTEAEVADDVVWQRHQEVFDRLPREASFLRRAMAVDLSVYLPGLGLAYVDRAGMEFGVEIRVPWLDLDLVRWSLELPDHLLTRRGRGKWLTRELAAEVLTPTIAHRPKRGFAAPASPVRAQAGRSGERGFRQGAYFSRARELLAAHLANPLDNDPSRRTAA